MPTFFEDHPPRLHQWQAVRDPQRKGLFHEATGTIVIHTYETPVTTGTLAAAWGLVNRTDRQASYHCLAGPASERDIVQMAPWLAAAWHETHSNRWSIGISMVTQAAAWGSISATQRNNLVKSAAYAAHLAASELHRTRGIVVPARRITRAEAMQGKPGFISHGEMDPGRRHDPGAGFPWSLFLTTYAALMGGKGSAPAPTPTPTTPDPLEEIMGWYGSQQEFREDIAGIVSTHVPRATFDSGLTEPDGRKVQVNVATALRWAHKLGRENRAALAVVNGRLAGLEKVVEQLASGQGLDVDAVRQAAYDGAHAGAADVSAADVADLLTVAVKTEEG